ncbi:MAG: transporter substrate-binding domain-containing protein [Anaerolineae bacterium]|nr:transporter substrate-binding domain-containing protein [Anaerolineae bacterium]
MKRFFLVTSLLAVLLGFGISATISAESAAQPVPTLVPPTLVPTVDAGVSDVLLAESALARVQRDGRVRVGMLYNAIPFGEFNLRGEVSGYDADLARSMAEAWGVEFEAVQVTRQTALDMLRTGAVDMLVAAQVHRRELDALVEFSLTYYPGTQSLLVRQDDGAAGLGDMANRRIGYVIASPSLDALTQWQMRAGVTVTTQQYLTLDQAVTALAANEVDAVAANRVLLTRLTTVQQGGARILEQALSPEPYAIVVRRQDVNWRNLINKTLQHLVQKGRMQEIQQAYFGTSYPLDLIPVWQGLGTEPPKPAEFSPDVTYPTQYALPRVQSNGVVRVAGVSDLPPDAPESQRRLEAFNRAMIEALAVRWGVRVEYLPNSAGNAADLVAAGQADLAVGVTLDWALTDRVDFSAPYLLHGERLLAKADGPYETFLDLRARWVAVFASEPGAEDRVNALAESVSSGVRIFTLNNEANAPQIILEERSADVVFGDSLKLIPHVQANPEALRLTVRGNNPDPWYSRVYVGIAVPRNDLDFRLLVEYTLQEMARDGSWQTLLAPVMLPDDIPAFDIWPGSSDYFGISLAS